MKCIVCQGEDIQVVQVRETLTFENDIVYVPITIPVCRACGEKYYDRRTVRYLEETEQTLQSGHAHLQEIGKVMVFS